MTPFYAIQLEIGLALLALGTLIWHAARPVADVRRLGYGLAAAVGALFIWSLLLPPAPGLFFSDTYRLDAFALFFKRVLLLTTAVVLVVAAEYSPRLEHGAAEHYVLLLLAAVGMLAMSSAVDFILMFVAMELVTIAFLPMVAQHRRQLGSLEAGTKYLVMGGLSTGLLVYGISYIFGVTGATHFSGVAAAIHAQGTPSTVLAFGIVFLLLGLSFKLAAVPGQMWAPDVYQGAPLPAMSFLATGSKIAGFALLLRLLMEGLLPAQSIWRPALLVIAGLTLLYGALGALMQRDLKRLLGYSSIAHTGYLLMGVVAMTVQGLSATLFYLAQYSLGSLAGFLAMAAVARAGGDSDRATFAGLHRRAPLLAAGLALSMLSLAGVPPLSGFVAKYFLLLAVLQPGPLFASRVTLAIVAAVGVVLSLYYYFVVVKTVAVDEPSDSTSIPVSLPLCVSMFVCLMAIIALGVYQQPLVAAAEQAVASLSLLP